MHCTYRRPLEPQQVARVSNVKYKSFHSAAEAQAWLQGIVDAMAPTAPPHDPSASQEQSGYEAEQAQLQLQLQPQPQGPSSSVSLSLGYLVL